MKPYRGKPLDKSVEWVYGWYVENFNHGLTSRATGSYIIDKHGNWNIVDPATVGQQVGKQAAKSYRKDLEIYEGDKIKYGDTCSDEWLMDETKTIGVVNWIDYKCGFCPQEIKENHKHGHYIALWDAIIDVEIIGTIHDKEQSK